MALEACDDDELVDGDFSELSSSAQGDDTICPGAGKGEDLPGATEASVAGGPRGTEAVTVPFSGPKLFGRTTDNSSLLVAVPVTRDKNEKKPCPEDDEGGGSAFSFRSSGGPSIPSRLAKDTNPD
jgi:hypothetical protein